MIRTRFISDTLESERRVSLVTRVSAQLLTVFRHDFSAQRTSWSFDLSSKKVCHRENAMAIGDNLSFSRKTGYAARYHFGPSAAGNLVAEKRL